MFAVIGKKIFDKLSTSVAFQQAQGVLGDSLLSGDNSTFDSSVGDWFHANPQPPRFVFHDTTEKALKVQTQGGSTAIGCYAFTDLSASTTYRITYTYKSDYETNWFIEDFGGTEIATQSNVAAGEGTTYFEFTTASTGSIYRICFQNNSTDAHSYGFLKEVQVTTTTGENTKVFPVIIPQGTAYPATIFEIANVDNFITKSSSLASCDVSLRIACFADDYNTTYNQSKAVVEALDYYSVTYTEDGVSYTAKFRFVSLDDDYYKLPEKFYKNLIFNCLITKN
jgi:hypothetical protein